MLSSMFESRSLFSFHVGSLDFLGVLFPGICLEAFNGEKFNILRVCKTVAVYR